MANSRMTNKRYKKKRKRRSIFKFVLFPILFLLLSGTVYFAFLYSKAESVMDDSYTPIERDSKRAEKVNPLKENFSILFIGVDDNDVRKYNDGSRSDALLLATFNKKAKSVKLLSIPRDSYVYIPSLKKKDKITHAHSNGGVKSTIDTVERFLDIPIDYYVKMNFNAFIEVVDALDGIEVDVPYTLNEMDSRDRANAIRLRPGLQELNGEEALALARTRHKDNDIERGKRQQEILKAIVKKSINVQAINKYPEVMEAVGKNMATDITFSEMKSLISYASAGTNLDFESLTLLGEDGYEGKKYIYNLDEVALRDTVRTLQVHLQLKNLAGTDKLNIEETTSSKNN